MLRARQHTMLSVAVSGMHSNTPCTTVKGISSPMAWGIVLYNDYCCACDDIPPNCLVCECTRVK